MYRRIIGAVLVLMMAVVFCGIGLKGCEKKAQAAEAVKPALPQVPEGYVIVEEDVLTVFVDAPGEHFHKTRENFLKKDYRAALYSIGIPKDSILKYETSLKANKFLLVVHGTAGEVEKAGQILKSTNATETTVHKV